MTTQTIVRLLADGIVIPIVLIAGYALFFRIPAGQRFEAYKRIFMAGLTAYLFAKLLGSIYQPTAERPFEMMGMTAGASYLPNPGFPSDHALFTMFLTLAVWFETRLKTLSIVMLALTLLVCLGRVLALVHTPLDVLGGIVVALTGTIWYVQRPQAAMMTKKTEKGRKNNG